MIIAITKEDKVKCFNFAKEIVKGNNQYARLGASDKKRIQRTYAGKLAEYAFLKYIRINYDSNYPEGDMFDIFQGESNVDAYDFKTKEGKTIDIKTAFLPNHMNIMVPLAQLNNMPKDIYIAIKLNGEFEDELNDKQLLEVNSITTASILGFIEYDDIKKLQTQNWGAPCKAVQLTNLKDIKNLNF